MQRSRSVLSSAGTNQATKLSKSHALTYFTSAEIDQHTAGQHKLRNLPIKCRWHADSLEQYKLHQSGRMQAHLHQSGGHDQQGCRGQIDTLLWRLDACMPCSLLSPHHAIWAVQPSTCS